MILAFTGAGISKASGIPTFEDMESVNIRDKLERNYAINHPEDYKKVIQEMKDMCDRAEPNDAHRALAEYGVPVITMNIDGLHIRAGSKDVLEIHGRFPGIVLYGDPAPNYGKAMDLVEALHDGDVFLIIGTSFYTTISEQLRILARGAGAKIVVINERAEEFVRRYLELNKDKIESYEALIERAQNNV